MRIDRIELTNFGSYQHAAFEFPTPITLIYATNNAGKTTLMDAIQWGMTGKCRGLDARGTGVEHVVRQGTDHATVGIALSHDGKGGTLSRAIKGRSTTLEISGVGGPSGTQQATFFKALGVNEDVLLALLNSRAFLDLGHADAKAVLLKALNVRVHVDGKALTLEQLDYAYDQDFKARTYAKAALQAIHVPAKPSEPAPDVPALEAALDNLRQQATARVAARATDDGRRQMLERQLTSAENDLARLSQSIGFAADVSDELLATEAALADTPAPNRAFEQTAREQLVDAEGRLKLAEQTAVAIVDHDPKKGCVLDATIPCKTPAKEFSGQIVKLEARVTELKAMIARAMDDIATHQQAQARHDEIRAKLTTLKDRARSREDLMKRKGECQSEVDRLHGEIAALPAVASKDEALIELEARIDRGHQTIEQARALVAQWTVYDDARAKAIAASKKVETLETRVEQLGPKGLRVQALAAAITAFEAIINDALAKFGYDLHFELDPWRVVVNGRSLVRLSASEQLRVGVALQLALASVTHLGCVLIDGVDMLVAKHRAILTELLEQHDGQAIVTATRDEEADVFPIDGVTVYRLRLVDGITSVQAVGEPVLA